MKRLFFFLFITALFTPYAFAQKKQISNAREQIKKRSNLEQAEASMRKLLEDSTNRGNIKIYATLAEAVRARYEVANEKFYLRQSTDTTAFFRAARDMFVAYESLDSMDMCPDKDGKVKLNYRKKNSTEIAAYRPNLFNGGIFFVGKGDYSASYDMFDTYLQCARQPLFTAQQYTMADSTAQAAAFWTVFCGFKLKDKSKATAYKQTALDSKTYRERTLVFLSEVYQQAKDTTEYLNSLRTGFSENPSSPFFFTHIMDYHGDNGHYDTALEIANRALESDSDNPLFLFGKSNALLNLGRYDECIAVCDTLLSRNDTIPDVYYNAGACYINKAVLLEKDLLTSRAKNLKTSKPYKLTVSYYKKALPYMEKFRQLCPSQQDRWAPMLYNVYLKLNMGTQFEEISNLLRKGGK